ncbi:MAG: MAPEG family protein [Ancalomicrobiaceae bacterium]|nr:MAPEG family protein [Ancalomicrobiaceae bacterium]
MPLTPTQRGVRTGAFVAAIATLAVVMLGSIYNPFQFAADLAVPERLAMAAEAALLPGVALAFAIAQLARHRFATSDDIDAAAGPAPTERARVLQALIQNTLEQAVLAVVAYAAWAAVMPANWLSAVPCAAITFLLGRAAFHFGYERGAAARSFGFGLTFYPTLFMLALLVLRIGEHLVGPTAH